MNLEDIVNNPEHPIMKEVDHHFNTKEGDTLVCLKCAQEYIRGAWDFYQLCPTCFNEYDRKKMEARIQWLDEQLNK